MSKSKKRKATDLDKSFAAAQATVEATATVETSATQATANETQATAKVEKLIRVLSTNESDSAMQALEATATVVSTRVARTDFEKLVAICAVCSDKVTERALTLDELIVAANSRMCFRSHKSSEATSNNSLDLQRALHRERAARLNVNVYKSNDALLNQRVVTSDKSNKSRLVDVQVTSEKAKAILTKYRDAIAIHNASK